MSEDFIVEEASDLNDGNRRPFLIAVGALAGILLLAVICIGAVLALRGRSNGGSSEAAAIETQNAIVAVTNDAVTRTVAAMQTEAARPTNTPVPPTNTPRSTETPLPTSTNTPVVQTPEEDTPTPTSGTNIASSDLGGAATPTPIAGLGGSSENALPETGIDAWGAVIAGFALIAVLIAARRLRAG